MSAGVGTSGGLLGGEGSRLVAAGLCRVGGHNNFVFHSRPDRTTHRFDFGGRPKWHMHQSRLLRVDKVPPSHFLARERKFDFGSTARRSLVEALPRIRIRPSLCEFASGETCVQCLSELSCSCRVGRTLCSTMRSLAAARLFRYHRTFCSIVLGASWDR